MKPYENVDIQLDDDVHEMMNKKADELNMTFNELANVILENHISKEITFEEYQKLIEKYLNKEKDSEEFINDFYTVVINEKTKIRIRPYSE